MFRQWQPHAPTTRGFVLFRIKRSRRRTMLTHISLFCFLFCGSYGWITQVGQVVSVIHQQLAARCKHPEKFCIRALRVGYGPHHVAIGDGIKRSIGKVKLLRLHLPRGKVHAVCCCVMPRLLKHGLRAIYGSGLHACKCKHYGKQARPGANIKHAASCTIRRGCAVKFAKQFALPQCGCAVCKLLLDKVTVALGRDIPAMAEKCPKGKSP